MKPIKCLYYDNILKGYHLYIIYVKEFIYTTTYTIAKAIVEDKKRNTAKLLFEVDGERKTPKEIKEQAVALLQVILEKGTL